jgi:hypothetical protein
MRYFEMLDSDELAWNNGHNLAVHHLLSLAETHDNVLSCGRQPCGKVKDVVLEAIPAWNEYEKERGWIHDERNFDMFKSEMKLQRKWAMTRPMFKGAMACCLWTLLAYWPSLKFTSIQQVHP